MCTVADKQQIQTGDGSTSVQTVSGTVIVGMQYAEVRQVALDIFKQQMQPFLVEAQQTATDRANEVFDAFYERVMVEPDDVKERLREPGTQRALTQAQIEHATYGKPEDVDLLGSLLVARMRERGKSMAAIATQAAIETVGQLRPQDLDLLSGLFLVLKVNFNSMTIEQLRLALSMRLLPLAASMTAEQDALRYLDATACIALDTTRAWQVRNNLRGTYPSLFEGIEETATLEHLSGGEGELLRILRLFDGGEISLANCFLTYKGIALAHANLGRLGELPSVRNWIPG